MRWRASCGCRWRSGGGAGGDAAAAGPLAVPVVRVQAAPARPPAPALRPVGARAEPRRYPIGEPGTPGFRYCDAPHRRASSYCPAHHQACWNPVKDRRAA